MKVSSRDFSDNNIKFKVDFNDSTRLNEALRMVEVFNDHLEKNKDQVRPVGFRINNFGTNNPLHSSEDYLETTINIIRSFDKYNYYDTIGLKPGEIVKVRVELDLKKVRMSDLKEGMVSAGIVYGDLANDDVIVNNMKEEITIEIVFGKFKTMPTHIESADICRSIDGEEYFICNVASRGALVYKVKDNNTLEVNANVFVSDPEDTYKKTIDSIKEQFNKF